MGIISLSLSKLPIQNLINFGMDCTNECRKFFKKKLLSRSLEGYKTERDSLLKMIKRTVEFGESDSVLILGPKGSGKTTLVEDILHKVKLLEEFKNQYVIVELHGLIHTSDNLAFRDISNQLNVDFGFEEEVCVSPDTWYSLFEKFDTTNDTPKAVIFVLEYFHCFCLHGNQNLLYILFDTAQSKKFPIFVVGITDHLNVIESLEKRVKSRFSGNKFYLFPKTDLNEKLAKFEELLTIDTCEELDSNYVKNWNKKIINLGTQLEVTDLLKKLFQISLNERFFTNFLYNSISYINEENPFLTKNHLKKAFEILQSDSKVQLMHSLSILELCIMISAFHQTEIYNNEPFNFEMVFQRYYKFAKSTSVVPCVSRHIAYKAFDTLVKLELLAPFSSTQTRSVSKEHILHRMLVTSEDVLESVKSYPNLLIDVSVWADNNVA